MQPEIITDEMIQEVKARMEEDARKAKKCLCGDRCDGPFGDGKQCLVCSSRPTAECMRTVITIAVLGAVVLWSAGAVRADEFLDRVRQVERLAAVCPCGSDSDCKGLCWSNDTGDPKDKDRPRVCTCGLAKPMPVGPKYQRLEWQYGSDGNVHLFGDGVQLGGWSWEKGGYWQSYDAATDEWDEPRSTVPYDVKPPPRAASLRHSVRFGGGGC